MYKTSAKFVERSLRRADKKINYSNASGASGKKNNRFLMGKASKIKVGAIVEGEVIELKDSGAIISIKGIKGFLPISQISDKWLNHPSEEFKVRTILKLKVIFKGIDKKGRFSLRLSKKALHRTNRENQNKSNTVNSNSKRKLKNYYNNIDSYIKKLGSLELVYSYYAGDSPRNEYARKVAPGLLNISRDELMKFLLKIEKTARPYQSERIIKLLNKKKIRFIQYCNKMRCKT
jgi:predicted RNA-binding protein with RPS1 domain